MTYDLIPIPVAVSPGDLLLVEPGAPIGAFSDVVRFNRPPPVGLPVAFDGETIPTLVFHSDNSDGVDALADVGLALLINPENNLRLTEIGGPEPATFAPLGIGLAGLGFSRCSRKQ